MSHKWEHPVTESNCSFKIRSLKAEIHRTGHEDSMLRIELSVTLPLIEVITRYYLVPPVGLEPTLT